MRKSITQSVYGVNWTIYFQNLVRKIYNLGKYIYGLCFFFLIIAGSYLIIDYELSLVKRQLATNIHELNSPSLKKDQDQFSKITMQRFNSSHNPVRISKKKKTKLILFWTGYYDQYWPWNKIFDRQLKNDCLNNCLFTSNKDKILEADAVVFHTGDLKTQQPELMQPKRTYPTKRMETQIYVLLTFEAAPNLQYLHPKSYNDFFNWTMNYRNDADVFMPYGKFLPIKKETKLNAYKVTDEDLKKRKNAAIWFVSHCLTQSKRENLVEMMQRYMTVDIYGICGDFDCGIPNFLGGTNLTNFRDPCQDTILNYKFYIAFENAICIDYVTEKLYRALDIGIIPVVYGGANYTAVAPPHSFIDVRNFNSTIELVKYLDKVGSNATLYNSYLKWKQDYNIDLGHPFRPHSCGLCDKLHDQTSINKFQSLNNLKKLTSLKTSCQEVKDVEDFMSSSIVNVN